MPGRTLNPIDEKLIAEIEDDIFEGRPARSNVAYAEAIGRPTETLRRILERLKADRVIEIEVDETGTRRRIYMAEHGAWTEWTDHGERRALKHRQRRRPCLCCGEAFVSEGIHNRLCAPCKARGGPPELERPALRVEAA